MLLNAQLVLAVFGPKTVFDTCYKNLIVQANIFKLMKSVKSTILNTWHSG